MISLQAVTEMHSDCIARWHQQPIDNPHDGILLVACEQSSLAPISEKLITWSPIRSESLSILWPTSTAKIKPNPPID